MARVSVATVAFISTADKPLVVALGRARHIDGVVEQQRELLGLVEVGRVLARQHDQLVEMAGIVIAAMGLRVVQPRGIDQGTVREQSHVSRPAPCGSS